MQLPENLHHIAIIMDGNGRWATQRGLPRIEGHREGIKAVRDTVEACAEMGLAYLTLYAFSVENWKRPEDEVSTLMDLLYEYLEKELPTMMKNNIRFGTIGRIWELPSHIQERLEKTIQKTEDNTGLNFYLALNYSGRAEILDALEKVLKEKKAITLTEEAFRHYLYAPTVPDPDLLIRTSGELRLSNFLLWQCAYTELYITPVLWPEFRRKDLYRAIEDFNRRNRRFGGIHA